MWRRWKELFRLNCSTVTMYISLLKIHLSAELIVDDDNNDNGDSKHLPWPVGRSLPLIA